MIKLLVSSGLGVSKSGGRASNLDNIPAFFYRDTEVT
jgi:hypothetical protein